MPKVLDDPRGAILKAARDNIEAEGWAALNIRAIAERAGMAQGTIYNYFDSNMAIAAELLHADWERVVACASRFSGDAARAESNLRLLFAALSEFMAIYRNFWAGLGAPGARPLYPHIGEGELLFRSSLERVVRAALAGRGPAPGIKPGFLAAFMAGAFLEWSREERFDYARLAPVVARLLGPAP